MNETPRPSAAESPRDLDAYRDSKGPSSYSDTASRFHQEGKVPFPDGTIIAAIHWTRVPSEDNNKGLAGSFPGAQSFAPATVSCRWGDRREAKP